VLFDVLFAGTGFPKFLWYLKGKWGEGKGRVFPLNFQRSNIVSGFMYKIG